MRNEYIKAIEKTGWRVECDAGTRIDRYTLTTPQAYEHPQFGIEEFTDRISCDVEVEKNANDKEFYMQLLSAVRPLAAKWREGVEDGIESADKDGWTDTIESNVGRMADVGEMWIIRKGAEARGECIRTDEMERDDYER